MKDIYWEQNSFMKDFAKEQRSLMKTKDITKKQSSITKDIMYRVFIKYCVFFQEFSKVCHHSLASTRLLLVVQKSTSKFE